MSLVQFDFRSTEFLIAQNELHCNPQTNDVSVFDSSFGE